MRFIFKHSEKKQNFFLYFTFVYEIIWDRSDSAVATAAADEDNSFAVMICFSFVLFCFTRLSSIIYFWVVFWCSSQFKYFERQKILSKLHVDWWDTMNPHCQTFTPTNPNCCRSTIFEISFLLFFCVVVVVTFFCCV